MKLTSDLLSLSPLGHSDGFASCKAWRVLISASLPKTPFPRERLCMLGWLCIVQSPCAYTPGIRAGGEYGDWRPCDLPWGYAPNPIFISYVGFSTECRRHDICRTAHIYCFLIVIQRTMCVYPCFAQILPVTVITAVPGVTETVPSVFVANVAAGTSIAPAVVSNTPVASL